MQWCKYFTSYLYGHDVTDHTPVKAILPGPNRTGKHARWWTKVYASGVQVINSIADALSRSANTSDRLKSLSEYSPDISTILQSDPIDTEAESFGEEQRKHRELSEILHCIQTEELPQTEK